MIKHIIKIGLLLLIGVLGYNYFLGSPTEKANSKEIFGKFKEVAVSVKDLVKNEKAKFDGGKYDKALSKLGGAYKSIREKVGGLDKKLLNKIDDLNDRKNELQKEIKEVEKSGDKKEETKLKDKMNKLMDDTQKVIDLIE